MSEISSFWTSRRAAVAAEEEAEARAAQLAAQADAIEGKGDAEILTELGLPDPETLQQGDDFSGFMASAVPEHLRKVALRTLWRSNPVLACVDGLNEYDDDYRAAMLLNEPVKTAYQVGKGMKAHIDEMARKAAAEENSDADVVLEVEQEAEQEPRVAAAEAGPVVRPEHSLENEEKSSDGIFFADETDELPMPRRMRFRFEETQV